MKFLNRTIVILIALFIMASLPGCLTAHKEGGTTGTGILTGQLPQFPDTDFLLSGNSFKTTLKSDPRGNLAAELPAGRYQLLLQRANGGLIVIKRDIVIENNLTFVVTDVDLIPVPSVSSVSVPMVYSTSVIIEWETDIESDGFVEYGTSELYGMASHAESDLKTRHRIQLYDLQPATTYHFRITAARYGLDSTRSYTRDYAFTTEP